MLLETDLSAGLLELACIHCFVGASIDQPELTVLQRDLCCCLSNDQELEDLALNMILNWAGKVARLHAGFVTHMSSHAKPCSARMRHCALAFFAVVLIAFRFPVEEQNIWWRNTLMRA